MRVSIPGYVQAALLKLQIDTTKKPQDALHRWDHPTYGAKTQYADTNNAELVEAQSILYMQ